MNNEMINKTQVKSLMIQISKMDKDGSLYDGKLPFLYKHNQELGSIMMELFFYSNEIPTIRKVGSNKVSVSKDNLNIFKKYIQMYINGDDSVINIKNIVKSLGNIKYDCNIEIHNEIYLQSKNVIASQSLARGEERIIL